MQHRFEEQPQVMLSAGGEEPAEVQDERPCPHGVLDAEFYLTERIAETRGMMHVARLSSLAGDSSASRAYCELSRELDRLFSQLLILHRGQRQ